MQCRRNDPYPDPTAPGKGSLRDVEVVTERLADDLARRELLRLGAGVDGALELRIETDRHDLGRRRSQPRPPATASPQLFDVVLSALDFRGDGVEVVVSRTRPDAVV